MSTYLYRKVQRKPPWTVLCTSDINIKDCVVLTFSLWNHTGAADLQTCDLNNFFSSTAEAGRLKVNCHRSHRGSSRVKILETFPLNQDTMARFHRSAPQLPWGLNTSVCLLDGVVPLATKPRPFPQSMLHLMLMFKWAYWFSTPLYSACSNS